MAREAHSHGGEGACAKVGNAILLGKDDGHRTRPIGFGELVGAIGDVLCNVGELCNVCDMDNQRVERRAFLGCENLGESFRLECVTGEPVNRFCRDGDDFTFLEEAGCFAYTCPWREFHSPKNRKSRRI